MGEEADRLLDNILWAEDEDDDLPEDPTVGPMSLILSEVLEKDRLDQFSILLGKIFPDATPREERRERPFRIAAEIGDHWIGFIGNIRPGSRNFTWEGHWRQNVRILTYSRHQPPRFKKGVAIDKASKVINDFSKVGGWLSWVYRKMCMTSVEVLRISLHPDQWMKDIGITFRAANDLRLMHAEWADVGALLVQALPWRAGKTEGSAICSIFRGGVKVGTLGVQKKDGYWRYGGKIDIGQLHERFRGKTLEFKKQSPATAGLSNEDVLKNAESLYAGTMLVWLLAESVHRELHVS